MPLPDSFWEEPEVDHEAIKRLFDKFMSNYDLAGALFDVMTQSPLVVDHTIPKVTDASS